MSKNYQKFLPVVVFFLTVIVGSSGAFVSLSFQNRKSNINVVETVQKEQVMGVSIAEEVVTTETASTVSDDGFSIAIKDEDATEVKNTEPVCLSFKTTVDGKPDENGQYPSGSTFGFVVKAQDIDSSDDIQAVAFSVYNSSTKESVKEFVCEGGLVKFSEKDKPYCTPFEYELSEDKNVKAENVMASVANYSFPDSGKYYVKAKVISSNGTSVMCVPDNSYE